MKIGIDASRANREHKSGVEWYSYHIIKKLALLDSKNEYILYTEEPLTGGLQDLTVDCDENVKDQITFDRKGFQIIKSPHNNFKAKILNWPLKFLWTQGRMSLEMIFNAPEVLFVPSHTLPIVHPKKSIVTIHDIGFVKNVSFYSRDKMGPEGNIARRLLDLFVRLFTLGKYGANTQDYLFWSTKYTLNKSKKILTVSDFSKKEIFDIYNTNEEKIEVVHNGFNKDLYRKIDDQDAINKVLHKYGIEKPYIFYVGRIEKKKNIPELIVAYAMMKDKNPNIKHKLVLAGTASFGYDVVNQLIEDYRLENDLITPGWVLERDMPYLYNGADAFVFPSKYEGFGIPLLQAMGCGVPVAASWAASIPEITGSAALLFNPNNTEKISEAIKEIILNKELRERLREKGYKRIEKFSWEKTSEKILKIIKEL